MSSLNPQRRKPHTRYPQDLALAQPKPNTRHCRPLKFSSSAGRFPTGPGFQTFFEPATHETYNRQQHAAVDERSTTPVRPPCGWSHALNTGGGGGLVLKRVTLATSSPSCPSAATPRPRRLLPSTGHTSRDRACAPGTSGYSSRDSRRNKTTVRLTHTLYTPYTALYRATHCLTQGYCLIQGYFHRPSQNQPGVEGYSCQPRPKPRDCRRVARLLHT